MTNIGTGRNLGVLASGRGSDFQAIIDAIQRKELDARIAVLICNNPGAPAIDRARRHGIPCEVIDHRGIGNEEFMEAIDAALRRHNADLVVLAGFMKVLSTTFVLRWQMRILNIHPSLLPSFPGAHAQKDALDHGAKVTGLTVHFVDEEVDHGPIIFQHPVEVRDEDTVESLSARILVSEHIWYPRVIGWVLDGRTTIRGRRVMVSR